MLVECRALGGCATGDAKITRGGRLRAKHVIHTVGPVWRGGGAGEPALLASCYRRSLEVAAAHGVETVAFPCISTGVYGYPVEAACAVALRTCAEFLRTHLQPREVTFVCFGRRDHEVYRAALARFAGIS